MSSGATRAMAPTVAVPALVSPREHFATVNRLRLHYLEWGKADAPPLLLLHGGSAHAHWWDWFAPTVADRYHVMALDLRGHGDSEWVEPAAYDVEDYVADVVAFIEAFDLQPLRLIGHSLGGTIAAVAAARVARRMVALVIVDSRVKASHDGVRFMQRLAQMPHPRYRSREQGVAQYRLLATRRELPPEIVAHIAAHALRQHGDDGKWTLKFDRRALAAITPHDFAPTLEHLRCPVLAVRGEASPLMPPAAIDALRAVNPQLEAVAIAGADHHVMLDRPAEFAKAVRVFLDAQTPRIS